MITIQTSRLLLRELLPSDAAEMFMLNEDPDVIRYTGDGPFKSIEEARNFLIGYDQYKKYGCGRLAMIEKQSLQFLGWCGLKYDEETKETDLGFRLHKKFWNQGYATEAAIACLKYGFTQLNLPIIIAHAMNANLASINILKKLGMTYTRDFEFKGNAGVFMQITKEEFIDRSIQKIDL